MGTVRIRYTNKKSIFDYSGIRKADVLEKVAEHLALFGQELKPIVGEKQLLDGAGFTSTEVPLSTVIAEWVENPGTPQETVESITLPT